jgi:hypothetical protein
MSCHVLSRETGKKDSTQEGLSSMELVRYIMLQVAPYPAFCDLFVASVSVDDLWFITCQHLCLLLGVYSDGQ